MVKYSPSHYNVIVPCIHENTAHFALYNTLSAALCLVRQDEWNKLLEHIDFTADQQKLGVDLAGQGFLVEQGTAREEDVFRHFYQQQVHDMRSMGSKVLLTMECNNRCRYCILDPEPVSMSEETAMAMDNWYCGMIEKNRPLKVEDDYLGGEPLLVQGLLLASANRRSEFCRSRNIAYSFSITTNGRLLDRQLVGKMKEAGLSRIRVSLAGPADIHDHLRPGRNGEATYGPILDNLQKISGLIPITVECQYDGLAADFRRLPEMLEDFLARGIEVDEVHFTPILARRGEGGFSGGMNDPRKQVWLEGEAARRSMASGEAGPPTSSCLAELRSRLVFDCRGNLLACPSLQTGEQAYGNVFTGIDFRAEAALCQRILPELCRTACPVLPLCKGGCRNQALVAHGDFNGVDCRRDEVLFLVRYYVVKEIMKAGIDFDGAWDEVFDYPTAPECQGLNWHG